MGYCTNYDFSNNSEEIISMIEDVSGCGSSYGGHYSDIKWYEHTEDMIKVSKMFPETLIVLEGIVEEFPDIWKAYYKNGKSFVSEAKIIFEDFDESKLKESK